MYNNSFNQMSDELKKENKNLRISCILGSILSPIITIIWEHFNSSTTENKFIVFTFGFAFSIILITLYILSHKNKFVRNKAYYFLYSIVQGCNISIVYFAYKGNFPTEQVFLLFLVSMVGILIIKRMSHLILYLSTNLILVSIALRLLEMPPLEKEKIISFLLVFYIIAYIYIRSKLETQKALKESEEQYKNLIDISPLPIIIHKDGIIVYLNQMALKLINGSESHEIIGKSMSELLSKKGENDIFDFGTNTDSEKHSVEREITLPDGRIIEVEASTIKVMYKGNPAVMTLFKDITERKITERNLIEAEALYRSLVESALVGVFLYQNNNFIYINPYIQKTLGYTLDDLKSIRYKDILFDDNATERSGKNVYNFCAMRKDGKKIYVEIYFSHITFKGVSTTIGTLLDVTHIRKAEKQIKAMAYHDALTGLPNRYMLNDYIKQKLISCKMDNKTLGIMFIDLDRFKFINDTLGHNVGDLILKQAARRIIKCVRKSDLVCRQGGDEFVVVLDDIDKQRISLIADRILDVFKRPFRVNQHEMYSTPSIGICFYPDDGGCGETLIKNADAAMYLAKERGKNNYQFYSESLNEAITKKMKLENGLRKALVNKELLLHYQPQIEMSTGKIAGMEALVRWNFPSMGLVSPMDFIPLAEENGLIIPIGEWVLETACMQNKLWQDKGYAKVPVAVNVSGNQLLYSDFVESVNKVLQKTKIDPQYVVIEITESIMQDTQHIKKIIKDLKAIGVKVAIDDFGTGYSSLSLLKNMPIDILKIDPSFIRDFSTNPNSIILTKNVINIAHELKYSIIAEGIEDKQQAQILKQNNCNMVQGYLFSRPLACNDIEEMLCNGVQFQNVVL